MMLENAGGGEAFCWVSTVFLTLRTVLLDMLNWSDFKFLNLFSAVSTPQPEARRVCGVCRGVTPRPHPTPGARTCSALRFFEGEAVAPRRSSCVDTSQRVASQASGAPY